MFLSVIITLQSKITCASNFYTYFTNYRRLLNANKSLPSPSSASSDAQTCYTTPRNCENDNSVRSGGIFEIGTNTNKESNSTKLITEKDGFSNAIMDVKMDSAHPKLEGFTPQTRIHSVNQLKKDRENYVVCMPRYLQELEPVYDMLQSSHFSSLSAPVDPPVSDLSSKSNFTKHVDSAAAQLPDKK